MKKWGRWMPSLVWMAFIFYLSHRSGSQLQGMFPIFQTFNWGHLVAYFVLAFCFYYALFPYRGTKKIKGRAILYSVIYGVLDEWHQSYIPSRTPELTDIINDFMGASFAMLLVFLYERRKTQ